MKQLKVPLHLQAEGSEDCGPMGTLMVLDYFNLTSDRNEVLSKVRRLKFGTSSFDNALVMLEYGLSVKMIISQPKLFNADFIQTNPDPKQIKAQIKVVKAKEKDPEKLQILASLLAFIEMGGEVILKKPSQEHVKQAIDQGSPVWVSMYADFLQKNGGGYHTVVVAGYDHQKFYILNPWPQSRQKSMENAPDVIYATHVSTLFDYDNGVFLIAKNE